MYIILIVTILVSIVYAWVPNTIKTAWLIFRTSPYEQTGEGIKNILILGDSTGYGTGVTDAQKSIAGRLGSDFPAYGIENNSVNGRTIGELVSVVSTVKGQYDLIVLQIGGNDILQQRDVSKVEKELREIVRVLSGHTDHLYMISTGNVGAAPQFAGTSKGEIMEQQTNIYREMFMRVSADTNLNFIDLYTEPAVDPFVLDPETYISADGLHPNAKGYGLWYEIARPALRRALD